MGVNPKAPTFFRNPAMRWHLSVAMWVASTVMLVDEWGRRQRRR